MIACNTGSTPYAGNYNQLRVIENEEQLWVITRNTLTGQRYVAKFGSIIKPLTDSGSNETDFRLKGMGTAGGVPLTQTFNFDIDNQFTDSYLTQNANQLNQAQIGIWSPANKNIFVGLSRISRYIISSVGAGMVDVNGDGPMLKIPYILSNSPKTFVGYGRQWYAMQDALDNMPINNRSAVLKGYTIASSDITVYDALAVMNS